MDPRRKSNVKEAVQDNQTGLSCGGHSRRERSNNGHRSREEDVENNNSISQFSIHIIIVLYLFMQNVFASLLIWSVNTMSNMVQRNKE